MAAQLCSDASGEDLFLRQVEPARQAPERLAAMQGVAELMKLWQSPAASPDSLPPAPGPFSPAVREPAARAGRLQAQRVSAELKAAY